MLWFKDSDAKSMPKWYARNCVFDGAKVADNKIDLNDANTQFADGDAVMYFSDAPVVGLTNGQVYYLKRHPGFKYEVCEIRGGDPLTIEAAEGSNLFIKYDVAETTEGATLGYAMIAIDKDTARKRVGGFVSPGWYRYFKYRTHDGFERARVELLVSVKSMDLDPDQAEDIGSVEEIKDPEKEVVLVADTPLEGKKVVTAKSIKADSLEAKDSEILLTASGDIFVRGLRTTGELPKDKSNAALKINGSEWVELSASDLGQKGYNAIEIGLDSKTEPPKRVVIDGVSISGELDNNAISIFGFAENAEVLIRNCVVKSCSNVFRISNRTNVPAKIIVENCRFEKYENGDAQWAGIFCLQDYTSGSKEAAADANQFGKLEITLRNCYDCNGEKIVTPEDISTVMGTGKGDQIAFVYNNWGSGNTKGSIYVPYSEDRYPKFKFE